MVYARIALGRETGVHDCETLDCIEVLKTSECGYGCGYSEHKYPTVIYICILYCHTGIGGIVTPSALGPSLRTSSHQTND